MDQPAGFDANSFFLALEFGVGTLVLFGKPLMRKWFPKFDETWFEGSAFGLATLILMGFAFRRVVKVPDLGNVIVFCVPYVVVALWIMVMLRFSSALQANKRRIEEVQASLNANPAGINKSISSTIDSTKGPVLAEIGTPFSLLPHHVRAQIKLAGNPHSNEIAMAVRGKWGKSSFDNIETDNLQCDGYFLEYTRWEPGGRYLSDTMIFRETDEAQVSPELESKLRNASRFFVPQAGTHRNVSLVVFLYKTLTVPEKVSLKQQLEMISKSENDPQNVHFDFWDKTDLKKYSLP